jgi:hypothetical protein
MKPKVSLAGMTNYIATTPSFPLSDPYKTPTYNSKFVHVNNNTTATTTLAIASANQVVDWVFLELRTGISGATTVVQTRSALLRADGNIVDMDGVSPVSFPGAAGNYYITVRHRTHLGFRSANVININGNAPVLNFSNNSIPTYGISPFTLTNGNYVMVGGDANSDGSIDSSDSAIWEIQNGLFQNNYSNTADFNLDGSVDSIDSAIWEINNGKYEELN